MLLYLARATQVMDLEIHLPPLLSRQRRDAAYEPRRSEDRPLHRPDAGGAGNQQRDDGVRHPLGRAYEGALRRAQLRRQRQQGALDRGGDRADKGMKVS